jgi:hypothetical protein
MKPMLGHDVRHASQAWALHLVTPLVESLLTWGSPVSVMYVSPLRHDEIDAKALVTGGTAGRSTGLQAAFVRDLSSNDRLAQIV